MGASYLLSSSLVPVLSNWLLKAENVHAEKLRGGGISTASEKRFYRWLDRVMGCPALLLGMLFAVWPSPCCC